jgi:hypothetical protein
MRVKGSGTASWDRLAEGLFEVARDPDEVVAR